MAFATRYGGTARFRAAGFIANDACVFIDALFAVAECGGCKFAFDARRTVSLCRATAAEERFWSAMLRVHHGLLKRTVLVYAARHGNVARVRWLLARGAPRDARDVDSWTALCFSSWIGHTEVARALLEAGASVDAAMNDGTTPLYIASQEGHVEVALALLAVGANVNAVRYGGFTPLSIASSHDNIELARLLLAHGADCGLLTDGGRVARLSARAFASSAAMRALLAQN